MIWNWQRGWHACSDGREECRGFRNRPRERRPVEFGKGEKDTQWKNIFFQQMVLGQLNMHMQEEKNKKHPQPTPHALNKT